MDRMNGGKHPFLVGINVLNANEARYFRDNGVENKPRIISSLFSIFISVII